MTPTKLKEEQPIVWGVLKWLGKVIGAAVIGGVTGAFAFYQTFTGMQTDLKAQGATLGVHSAQIEALERADLALQQTDIQHAIKDAADDARVAAEREATQQQLKQIRDDLVFLQRELVGRIRR